MAKITAQQIQDMGFVGEMFGQPADFVAMIDGLIAEQSELLEGRIGAAAYAGTAKPEAAYVTRAEKCLVAAEMIQGRIIYSTGNAVPNGEEPDTTSLDRQRRKYLDEASALIAKIVAGVSVDSDDFASGVSISSGCSRSTLMSSRGDT